jgi:RHS repeat-associated protein
MLGKESRQIGRVMRALKKLRSTFVQLSLLGLLLVSDAQFAHAERKTTFFHTDALGSIVAASDESGALLWRKAYAPFGEQIHTIVEREKLSYTGKEHDKDTGLTYFGARYYDPQLGRFLSVDPVGFNASKPMSFNRYAYANNNPYAYVDPDGRDPERIFGIMMGIVHTKENALRIQQAEFAANNFAAAGGIDAGIALVEAKRAFDRGESVSAAVTAGTTAVISAVATKKKGPYSGRYADGQKAYRTNVPRDSKTTPIPLEDASGPHSRLQRDAQDPGRIYSATEFDAAGNATKRVDFAGRQGDVLPHQHAYDPVTKAFGDKKPLD